MTRASVLIYVQHLLGTGHLHRAMLIARALDESDFNVHLVSGGRPLRDLEFGSVHFHQLPPIAAADESFTALVDDCGQPVSNDLRDTRRMLLLNVFERSGADVVIFEMFPFGRRQMAFEIRPLMDRIVSRSPRPLLVSSVRDIVQARTQAIVAEMAEEAARFDHILIHGDPTFVAFEASFPLTMKIQGRLHYTGYVIPPPAPRGQPGEPGWDEVIVSAGGGAVGLALLEAALHARALTTLRHSPWRLLAGPNLADDAFAALRNAAPPGMTVERTRPDFRQLLANCRLSVSQAGYNTIMEVIAARAPAVVVPYSGQGQTEQNLRADMLERRGLAVSVAEKDLTPDRLAHAIDRIARASDRSAPVIRMNGAAESARQIARWLESKQTTHDQDRS